LLYITNKPKKLTNSISVALLNFITWLVVIWLKVYVLHN